MSGAWTLYLVDMSGKENRYLVHPNVYKIVSIRVEGRPENKQGSNGEIKRYECDDTAGVRLSWQCVPRKKPPWNYSLNDQHSSGLFLRTSTLQSRPTRWPCCRISKRSRSCRRFLWDLFLHSAQSASQSACLLQNAAYATVRYTGISLRPMPARRVEGRPPFPQQHRDRAVQSKGLPLGVLDPGGDHSQVVEQVVIRAGHEGYSWVGSNLAGQVRSGRARVG